jgi:hypothetical protein
MSIPSNSIEENMTPTNGESTQPTNSREQPAFMRSRDRLLRLIAIRRGSSEN